MKKNLLPFTTLLHNTLLLLEEKFLLFVAVATIPLLATYVCYWLVLGVLMTDLQSVTSFAQLQQLFSWNSSAPYLIIFASLFITIVTIFGLLGTPIVATYNQHITWRTVVPRILRYVLPYIRLTLLTGLCLFGVVLLSYALATIVIGVTGLIQREYLDPFYSAVIPLFPNLMVLFSGLFFIFTPYVLVSQERGQAWPAMLTSVRLVRRHFWGIVVRVGLVIALLSILASVLQFIPVVGVALALILSNITLTAYNYILYQHLINI